MNHPNNAVTVAKWGQYWIAHEGRQAIWEAETKQEVLDKVGPCRAVRRFTDGSEKDIESGSYEYCHGAHQVGSRSLDSFVVIIRETKEN